MADAALRTLHHRSEQLRKKLRSGTHTEVKAAREMLRLSLVELYALGYWQAQPEKLHDYMRLYRTAEADFRTLKCNGELILRRSRT
jgi:hypothetical protein